MTSVKPIGRNLQRVWQAMLELKATMGGRKTEQRSRTLGQNTIAIDSLLASALRAVMQLAFMLSCTLDSRLVR